MKLLDECLEHLYCLVTFNYHHYFWLFPSAKRDDCYIPSPLLLCLCPYFSFYLEFSFPLQTLPIIQHLVQYHLLHVALPDPPAGRSCFYLLTSRHLVQSYSTERSAESSLFINGTWDHLLGPRKFPGSLPLGWRLTLAGGHKGAICRGANFHRL